jgi:hypothetical protein
LGANPGSGGAAMKKIFLSYSANSKSTEFARYLTQALWKYHFTVLGTDQWIFPFPLLGGVQDAIKQCSLVIAFVTLPSPNIFYQIGYAEGIGKKVVLLAESESDVPSDLKAMRMFLFDRTDSSFVNRLAGILDEEEPKEGDTDRTDYILSDRPEYIFELYQFHRASFEQIDNRTFEKVVYRLFERGGYNIRKHSDNSLASFDFEVKNFEGGKRAIVEVKKYHASGKISIGQVQQLLGIVAAEKADCGVLISPTEFTRTAIDFVSRCKPNIQLWDLQELRRRLGFQTIEST